MSARAFRWEGIIWCPNRAIYASLNRRTTSAFTLFSAVLLALLIPAATEASLEPVPALDVNAPVILVLPSSWESPREPVVLRARVSDTSGIGRVTAWVMGENDEDYRPYPMQLAPDGGYEARLPAFREAEGADAAQDPAAPVQRSAIHPGGRFPQRPGVREGQDPCQLVGAVPGPGVAQCRRRLGQELRKADRRVVPQERADDLNAHG